MYRVVGFLALAFSLSLSSAQAGDIRDQKYLADVDKGYVHLYNLEYEGALSIFIKLKSQRPEHPGPPLDLAVAIWQRELFRRQELDLDRFASLSYFAEPTDKEMPPEERQTFFANLERSQELSRKLLEKDPQNNDARYYLGASYGVEASFALTIDHSKLDALDLGKKSYEQHRQLIEDAPNYHDAYLTVAVYEYIADNLPWYIKWLAVIVGYSGDEAQAFQYLRRVVEHGFVKDNTRVIQMILFVREERYEDALEKARYLHENYPRNYLFHVNVAQILEKMDRNDEAADVYVEILQKLEAGAPNYHKADVPELRFRIANKLFDYGGHDVARREFRRIAEGAEEQERKAVAHLRLGQIADLEGDRSEARSHYREAIRLSASDDVRDLADDLLEEPYRLQP